MRKQKQLYPGILGILQNKVSHRWEEGKGQISLLHFLQYFLPKWDQHDIFSFKIKSVFQVISWHDSVMFMHSIAMA